MIHGGEHHRYRFSRQRAKTALQRAEHPALGIWIHGECRFGRPFNARANFGGLVAEYDDHVARYLREQPDHAVEEGLAFKFQQSFGSAHAHRCTAGQDETGNGTARIHFRMAREVSVAKIDLESDRQSESGARRMAIISATIEMAISSGVMAPISRPMGAKMRSKAARGTFSFSSSLTTPITLRLLPIMAMYFALVSTAQRSTRMSSRWPRVTMTM